MIIPSLRLSNVAFALGITTTHLGIQRRLLYTDSMTGVFNRAYMDNFLYENSKSTLKTIYGGLLIDINSFKEINDTYGHLEGDNAIKDAANIIEQTCGSDYHIIRYGGDEFILICENESTEKLQAQKAKIKEAVNTFNRLSHSVYELSFSIGIATYDTSKGKLDQFLEQLDQTLYQDKKAYYENTGKERRR